VRYFRIDVILLTMAVDFTIRGKLGRSWYSGDSPCATPALVLALPCRRTPCLALDGTTECCAIIPLRAGRTARAEVRAPPQRLPAPPRMPVHRVHQGRGTAAAPQRIANSLLHAQPTYIDVHPVDSPRPTASHQRRSEPQEFLSRAWLGTTA
jgi:hypothetical protein